MWALGASASTTAVAAAMPEPNSSASAAPSSAATTASVWRTVALSGRPYTNPARYWLSGSRMNVVATCTGGTTALVAGSIAPSAWAASVRGCNESLDLSIMAGLHHEPPGIVDRATWPRGPRNGKRRHYERIELLCGADRGRGRRHSASARARPPDAGRLAPPRDTAASAAGAVP